MAVSETTVVIRTATAAEADRVVAALTLAFSTDPVARWAYPDPQRYQTYWPDLVRGFGGRAFDHGTAHYAAEVAGAALWLPPGVRPDEEALVDLLEHSIPGRDQADVFGVLEQMGSYHPSESHWYLPLIGVDPLHQGKGYGSALLRHALALCDRDRLPAYLESSNPRNIPLYERHGFEVLSTIQAGSSPPLWPMLRRPHERSGAQGTVGG